MPAYRRCGIPGNIAAAEDIHKQALALHPDDPDVLNTVSNGLAVHGRVKEAVSMREKLRTLEPFVPIYNYITASIMLNNGQSQAAIAILKELDGRSLPHYNLARAYATADVMRSRNTLLTIKTSKAGNRSRKPRGFSVPLPRKFLCRTLCPHGTSLKVSWASSTSMSARQLILIRQNRVFSSSRIFLALFPPLCKRERV